MKSKSRKKEELESLEKKFPESKIAVFTSFAQSDKKGLSVAELRELKLALRDAESEYVVSKKTLIKKASAKSNIADFDPRKFDGSLGVAFGYGDPLGTAKSVYNFSKKSDALVVHGAFFENEFIGADRFMELAKLPGRDVLMGRALGMLNYPMTGLVSTLQGNLKNLLLVLSNIKK